MNRKIALTLYANDKTAVINTAYISFVAAAGYDPVIITQYNSELLDTCDGLLIPGGIDISPIPYGENNVGSLSVNPRRDAFERAMMLEAFSAGKPVFGICRGFQLICREILSTVAKRKPGNFFYKQHINGHNQTQSDCPRDAEFHYVYSYDMSLLPAENVADDNKMLPVNSMHHQAVMAVDVEKTISTEDGSTEFEVTAVAAEALKDGLHTVEAVKGYHMHTKFMAVQWHPEELMQLWLLTRFFGKEG